MGYNWQQKDWPKFSYDASVVEDELLHFAEKTGHLSGIVKALPDDIQTEASIEMMLTEAIKTSAIEGEYLNREDVMSSIKNRLALNARPVQVRDQRAQGIGELMIEVRNTYKNKLSRTSLFEWHKLLMKGSRGIEVGKWRTHDEPMQVISGAMGKEVIHFEAPPSRLVSKEMVQFIYWFNETAPGQTKEIRKAPVRAAIAHLYFETIHPFEDGNGRIGRAIAEKALAQGVGKPVILSISQAIESKKKEYYNALKQAQRKNEITNWIIYFVKTLISAQDYAGKQIDLTLRRTKYFDQFKEKFNDRQLKVIRKMLAPGAEGFEGGMNARKYSSITKVSKATATRDLQDLLEIKAIRLFGEAGGRSTSYEVNL